MNQLASEHVCVYRPHTIQQIVVNYQTKVYVFSPFKYNMISALTISLCVC